MSDLPDAKRILRSELDFSRSSPSYSVPNPNLSALFQTQLAELYGPLRYDAATLLASRTSSNSTTSSTSTTSSSTTSTNTSKRADGAMTGSSPESTDVDADAHTDTSTADPSLPTTPFPHNDTSTAFEFRLFSTSTTKTTTSTITTTTTSAPQITAPTSTSSATVARPLPKILLDNDDDHDAAYVRRSGAFTVPTRDKRYYFASPATGDARRRFEDMAVSGDEVKTWVGSRYSGWELPWRVRRVKVVIGAGATTTTGGQSANKREVRNDLVAGGQTMQGLGPGLVQEEEEGEEDKKRKGKPGKKRRIILRVWKRKVEEAREKRSREEREREEREREKRTRRNREKKVKRKAKEKLKKAAGVGVGVGTAVTAITPTS